MRVQIIHLIFLGLSFNAFGTCNSTCHFTVKNIPKKYRNTKNIYINPHAKAFCSEFAFDYFYRLTAFTEELNYPSNENPSQSFMRPRFSVKGALFSLGQVRVEAGWAKRGQLVRRNNNYWGIGGAYTLKNGKSTFAKFSSFEAGFAYTMNTMKRGIMTSGSDNYRNPGWPDFIDLLQKEDFTNSQVNKALNSGPHCKTFPAYNTDRSEQNPKSCINYAGEIMNFSVKLLLQQCLATAKFHSNSVMDAKSVVFKNDGEDFDYIINRRYEAIRAMKKYAMKHFSGIFCE